MVQTYWIQEKTEKEELFEVFFSYTVFTILYDYILNENSKTFYDGLTIECHVIRCYKS